MWLGCGKATRGNYLLSSLALPTLLRIYHVAYVLQASEAGSRISTLFSYKVPASPTCFPSPSMEALTAVGLASNVVQFISFARELVSTTGRISKSADGALIEDLEITATARSLQDMCRDLQAPNLGYGSPKTSKEDNQLVKLCERCQTIAQLLLETIDSLQVKTKINGRTAKKWASFRQAFNSILAADEIAELESRLDRYQKAIDTTLLMSLRYALSG